MNRVALFVTWDGPQTSYLETLFYPLFSHLHGFGWSFHVIQFTWADIDQIELRRQLAYESGLLFSAIHVSRGRGIVPHAWSLLKGLWEFRKIVLGYRGAVLVFRSIASAVIVRLSSVRTRVKLVYDSDGLPIEEKLEDQALRHGSVLHRFLQGTEIWALKNSLAILARSQFGARELLRKAPQYLTDDKVHVVSNGRVQIRRKIAEPNRGVNFTDEKSLSLCYLGSWGSVYRPQRMLELVRELRGAFPQTEFKIFTGDIDKARSDLVQSGLELAHWITIGRLEAREVKENLAICDVGFSLRELTTGTRATSPVKLGEYLESGLAVIGDTVGDRTEDLANAGLLFSPDNRDSGELFQWISSNVLSDRNARRLRAADLGERLFSIEESAEQYLQALLAASG